MNQTHRRAVVIHPLLFAIYPPLALLANNILQIRPVDSIRSVVVFFIFGGLVFLLCKWIFKDWVKSGLVASILILSFSSYGQVYSALEVSTVFKSTLGRHRFLAPVWLLGTAALLVWVIRYKGKMLLANSAGNLISIALLVMPLANLTNSAWLSYKYSNSNKASVDKISQTAGTSTSVKPDVYYIILDMYARDDILMDRYHYDNSAFLSELEKLGFYVARCSVTNYNMTELSLASSFNMNYLDVLGDQYRVGQTDRSGLVSLIHQSAIRQIFQGMGYKFVNYETGFTFTEIRDADFFLSPPQSDYGNSPSVQLNAFESMLVKTTAMVLVTDAQAKWADPVNSALDTRKAHIVRELYLLDSLPKLAADLPGPKLVYAHILIPHPPFVFSKDGVNLSFPGNDGATTYGPSEKDYAIGYRNQLDYINTAMLPILQQIIRDSKTPPVIIIQGDHGVDPKRSYNLNAYYFPGEAKKTLYPTLSPVNTFRLVLDDYFNGKYDLLPDINYASSDKKPFDFTEISNERICTP
jgi:hypothetical protein